MSWEVLILLALVIEGIVANIKFLWTKDEFSVSRLVSLIVAIIVAILTKADLFPLVGLPIEIPLIGSGLTGIAISAGAGALYDLINKLKGGN